MSEEKKQNKQAEMNKIIKSIKTAQRELLKAKKGMKDLEMLQEVQTREDSITIVKGLNTYYDYLNQTSREEDLADLSRWSLQEMLTADNISRSIQPELPKYTDSLHIAKVFTLIHTGPAFHEPTMAQSDKVLFVLSENDFEVIKTLKKLLPFDSVNSSTEPFYVYYPPEGTSTQNMNYR